MDDVIVNLYHLQARLSALENDPLASAGDRQLAQSMIQIAGAVRELAIWIRDRETYEAEQLEKADE